MSYRMQQQKPDTPARNNLQKLLQERRSTMMNKVTNFFKETFAEYRDFVCKYYQYSMFR